MEENCAFLTQELSTRDAQVKELRGEVDSSRRIASQAASLQKQVEELSTAKDMAVAEAQHHQATCATQEAQLEVMVRKFLTLSVYGFNAVLTLSLTHTAPWLTNPSDLLHTQLKDANTTIKNLMEHSAELDGELEMMSLERKAQEAELEAQGAQLKEAQKAASYVKSKEELGLRAAVEQVERTADEARKEAIADAAKAREEASEVRRAMQCEKEAFEKEVAKLREEASRTAQELSSAEQRSATLAEENRKLEAETFTCAREMEQRGEARQAEEVAALQAQLKEQKNLCANLAMEAKEWQLMAAQGESTMRQLQQRLDQAGSELTQARAELAESQAQHAILSEKLARSEKGAYTAEWMELAEHWEAEANSHLQEAVEAQRKLEQTKASLDVALSTSDAIKIEVEKEFARLTEEASVSEAKAATLEHEASLMKVFLIPYRCDPTLSHADPVFQVTIATLTAEQGHLKTQLDTVLAEARCAATAAADMGQAVAALSTHAGQPRRTPGQESASRARRCASPSPRDARAT